MKTFQQQLAEAIDGRSIPAPSFPVPLFVDYPVFDTKPLTEEDKRLLQLIREFGVKHSGKR